MRNGFSVPDALRPHPLLTSANQSRDMRAARVGVALTQIVCWRANLEPGWLRDDLSHIARMLVDDIHSKFMPTGSLRLIASLPENDEGCGTAPWSNYALQRLRGMLGSCCEPVRLGIDESGLGARALAGVIIAKLWTDPSMQGCVAELAACESVEGVRTRLQALLALAEQPQRPSEVEAARIDLLCSALELVETFDTSRVGRTLMHPVQRRIEWTDFPQLAA
jgi:hypothetical protein